MQHEESDPKEPLHIHKSASCRIYPQQLIKSHSNGNHAVTGKPEKYTENYEQNSMDEEK